MLEKLNKNVVLAFFIKSGFLYLLWVFLYYYNIEPKTLIDEKFITHIINSSAFALQTLGYNTFQETRDTTFQLVGIVGGINNQGVWVGAACNAISLFALFTIFIISFPGNWLKKIWFIPLGIIIIHLVNILRVCILAIIAHKDIRYLSFNHTYTFTILVYTIIFLLWIWWVNNFSHSINKEL